MKITAINSHIGYGPRYPWVFITIETDEGLTGLGQAQGGIAAHMIHAAIPHLGELLIGEDSSRIDYIWTRLFSELNSTGNRGFGSALISAVDIALWDIKGKRHGLPIYELIGGKFRDDLRLYSNGWFNRGPTPEGYAQAAFETIAEGHTALKMDPFWEFDDVSPLQHGHNISPTGLRKGVEITRAVRNAIGPDVELLIDLHGRYDVAAAVRVGKALGEFDIGWLEEPVPPENHDALKLVKEQVPMPICVGERLVTRWDFRPILDRQLANYIMPDIVRCGGISEMRKIATMAEAYYIPVSPHDATGPITMAAGAQVMMSTPNFYRLEIAYSELPYYNAALTPALDVRNGFYHVSDAPGLGHELNPDYIAAGPDKSLID